MVRERGGTRERVHSGSRKEKITQTKRNRRVGRDEGGASNQMKSDGGGGAGRGGGRGRGGGGDDNNK